MTLKQFVESTWFKGLARLCMVVAVPALLSVGGLILGLMGDVGGVKAFSAARAADQEKFQASIAGDVSGVKDDIAAVKANLGMVQIDVATIKGILQEIQRRDVPQRTGLRIQ